MVRRKTDSSSSGPKSGGSRGRPKTATAQVLFNLAGTTGGPGNAVHAGVLRFSPEVAAYKGTLRPGAARGIEDAVAFEITDDDLLEIEFENGERLWMNSADYQERFIGPGKRGVAAGPVVVPASMSFVPEGMAARGVVTWVVKSLTVLGFKPEAGAASLIAAKAEQRAGLKRPGVGLFRLALDTGPFPTLEAPAPFGDADRPFLVFLHGTLSSTWGSFGDLWSEGRSQELDRLREAYGDRALAFEHYTLPLSPFRNALDLVRALDAALPEGARVHLVSHSRGGLVGDLLSRGRDDQGAAFSPEEFQILDRAITQVDTDPLTAGLPQAKRRDIKQGYQAAKAELKELADALAGRKFTVERFVRVASPALGTTLASGRMDRWLSVIGSLAGAALPGTPWAEVFKEFGDFVAAVIHERTNPRTLPGLEAMMPGSPCVRVVNWQSATADGDLAVIAGDIDPDKWWANLLVWISDRFYEGDHDLVVNTASMFGGTRRLGQSKASRHKGPQVNHFNYFTNPDSAGRLVQALAGDYSGFQPLDIDQATDEIARGLFFKTKPRPVPAGPLPVVFVLPGIMGSELSLADQIIWANLGWLATGGLGKLALGAKGVTPCDVIHSYYGDLCDYLAGSHKVIKFPFDWRLPVEDEADRLADHVQAEFAEASRQGQPVRILAHSMGGLVARTLIARHPDLWRQVCGHPQARLVMLGTPNGGSHSITELLVGQSATLQKLALLDFTHSQRELLQIISRYPGVLAMLPEDAREDYFAPATWRAYAAKAGSMARWVTPDAKDLERARAWRQSFASHTLDPAHAAYVAGRADVTLEGMHLKPGEDDPEWMIVFSATGRGDGKVTWASGIPPELAADRCWYLDVEHGDMPADRDSFPAFEELLIQGGTKLLPQSPPVSRSASSAIFPAPRKAETLYPDQATLLAAALGGGTRKRRQSVQRERPVAVHMIHGSLAFARHPIVAGHYAGDTIISAEAFLDSRLNGSLRRRHQLGLYPGPLKTCALFMNPALAGNPAARPRGALIVGLGSVGGLSPGGLGDSLAQGILEYALSWQEGRIGGLDCEDGRLGLSALLVGTGTGGVSLEESLAALLQGVAQANAHLRTARQAARIGTLEIIELWQDRAIQAGHALVRMAENDLYRGAFEIHPDLLIQSGGRRRASFSEAPGWWDRLQVLGSPRPDQTGDGTLRFSALTRRARAEVRLQATQRRLVDDFVAQSIQTTRDNQAVARTLFELLLPNELKDRAPDQGNLVLVLDEDAAHYPWELLQDPACAEQRPPAVEHGLVRQLESLAFRETVREVTAQTALVIGDPLSEFPVLPGAQAEAEAVWRLLQGQAFRVEKRIRPSGKEVLNALFAQPYRVLHLAGHGVYRQALPATNAATGDGAPSQPLTGMILGNGSVLSPVEVGQMRQVPELVFVNCCHLGYIEAGGSGSNNARNDYNRIAANLATEFIRMGVRAVVAAGWAVDDGAATTFATGFYQALLEGRPFGEAVTLARQAAYAQHPQVNTWGAYQCYGDPDYRLARDVAAPEGHKETSYLAPEELVIAIEAELASLLEGGAPAAGEAETQASLKRLAGLEGIARNKNWLHHGGIQTALGRAYGQNGDLAAAVSHFQAALRCEDGAMTLRDWEQLANFQVRLALAHKHGREAERRAVVARIDQAMAHIAALPVTVERLSLLGGAAKRRALLTRDEERIGSLLTMRDHYTAAARLAESAKEDDSYPRLNVLAGEMALGWIGQAALTPAKLSAALNALRKRVAARLLAKPDFWTTVMLAECDLLQALNHGAAGLPRLAGDIEREYRAARGLAAPREFRSVLDQIDFLADLAKPRSAEKKALRGLAERLRT